MGGIVIELQREALDEKISIESLIRKAYLVAKKLKLKEFEEWLNQEQNGYKKEIPEYRNITGEIKAWNPYHGWIPMILPAKVADIASRMPIPNSISSLLDVYNSSEDRVAFSVNGAMTEFFNNSTDFMPTWDRGFFLLDLCGCHDVSSAVLREQRHCSGVYHCVCVFRHDFL